MKTKHTKGEWKSVHTPESGENEYAVTSNGVLLATVLNTEEQCEANAKLIAAAPEMLSLLNDLKFTLNFLTHDEKQNKMMGIDIKRIESLIKKATE